MADEIMKGMSQISIDDNNENRGETNINQLSGEYSASLVFDFVRFCNMLDAYARQFHLNRKRTKQQLSKFK